MQDFEYRFPVIVNQVLLNNKRTEIVYIIGITAFVLSFVPDKSFVN